MSIINSQPRIGAAGQSTGFKIERSLRFNSADSAYLNRTPASAGNRRTWTWSAWVKLGNVGNWGGLFNAGTSGDQFAIYLFTDSTLYIQDFVSPANNIQIQTTQVFRDPSAWYHIVVAIDTTQATSSNRVKVYINGSQVTAFSTSTYPSQNYDTQVNSTSFAHNVGRNFQFATSTAKYFDGYMTEVYFIDGSTPTTTTRTVGGVTETVLTQFGEFDTDTGVWKPKAYSGSYGTNGFYLKFADNSGTTSTTLGKDSSGNGNNWTPNNFYVGPGTTNAEKAGIDSLVDTPTPYGTDTGAGGEVRGNYCTLNPLTKGAYLTLSNGNLQTAGNSATDSTDARSTFAFSTGKWYWEFTPTTINSIYPFNGIILSKDATSPNTGTTNQVGVATDSCAYLASGSKRVSNSTTSYGNSYTANDVIGVAVDADNGAIYFSKNGTWQNSGSPTSGSSKTGAAFTWTGGASEYVAAVSEYNTSAANINFGQRPFAYTAPSGFKALCTQNLPTPTIGATATTRADDYFNTIIWTGTDTAASRSFTGVGFQPDFVWAKIRSNTGFEHLLYDAVRGAGNDKELSSDSTGAEGYLNTDAQGYLSSFNSDGFSSTVGTIQNEWFNRTGYTYVAWNWKANGAGSSNTAGSITSTVSANEAAGFSIVTYTGNGTSGATVGHGLNATPRMMIFKQRSGTTSWPVYHASLTSANYALFLNLTIAEDGPNAAYFNNTAPSSTLFTLGNLAGINGNGNTFVAYCFAPIAGYSAFGSYTGNGSADGPMVFTGFRPRYVMLKASSRIEAWYLFDTARNPYNVADNRLYANTSGAEGTGGSYGPDILSNGFKLRTSDSGFNFSGATYVYACFAENPFKYSLAR